MRLRPGDPPAPSLALVAAVALHEVVAGLVPEQDVRIKWPNDLLAGEAKLSGILLERTGDAVVIGIGVNLAHHPGDLGRPATSVAALSDTPPDPAPFLEMLAEGFARWLRRWREEGTASIRTAWLAAAHPVGTALVTSEGEGLFHGLDETGALRLRLADGTISIINAGDVFLA